MDVYRKGFEKGSAVKYMYEKCGHEKEIHMHSEMMSMILKCFVWSDMALPWEMQLSS